MSCLELIHVRAFSRAGWSKQTSGKRDEEHWGRPLFSSGPVMADDDYNTDQ